MVLLLFDGFTAKLPPQKGYIIVRISQPQIDSLTAMWDNLEGLPQDVTDDALLAANAPFQGRPFLPGLPVPNAAMPWANVTLEENMRVAYSYLGLMTFLVTKRVDPANPASLEVNRPRSLREKFALGDTVELLDGSIKMSRRGHDGINSAWVQLTILRKEMFREFAYYATSDTDLGQDTMYTVVHLMRFGGMQHAQIAYKFLRTYPWASSLPALGSAVTVLRDSIRGAASIPVAEQPFIKAMEGDKTPLFPRKDMEPLVACAVLAEQEIHSTLSNFYRSDAFGAATEAFMNERAARALVRTTQIARQMGRAPPDVYQRGTPAGPSEAPEDEWQEEEEEGEPQ